MGYETIQKHRKELGEKIKTFEALVAAAKPLTERIQKIAAAQKQIEEQWSNVSALTDKLAKDIEKIDTKGVKEFEDFHKSLVEISKNNSLMARPLPTRPMEAALAKMRKDIELEQRKWIERLAANMPSELKPGMVLIDKTIGNEYVIKSGPEKAQNSNLTGDASIFYRIICHRQGKQSEFDLSLKDLKRQGMKFVRS